MINRPFLSATLIGATTMEQLARNIASINLELTPEIVESIEEIHKSQAQSVPLIPAQESRRRVRAGPIGRYRGMGPQGDWSACFANAPTLPVRRSIWRN